MSLAGAIAVKNLNNAMAKKVNCTYVKSKTHSSKLNFIVIVGLRLRSALGI
jgi:hypothetical protein